MVIWREENTVSLTDSQMKLLENWARLAEEKWVFTSVSMILPYGAGILSDYQRKQRT